MLDFHIPARFLIMDRNQAHQCTIGLRHFALITDLMCSHDIGDTEFMRNAINLFAKHWKDYPSRLVSGILVNIEVQPAA